jgi:streptogrisin B
VYSAGTAFDGGGIAATGLGSITITGTNNVSSEGSASVGQTVRKTGRTTGTTEGRVTRTCVNTGVSGSNVVQLCQNWVDAGVGSGDSGSPVYSGGTLLGILWGGNSSGTTYVFSPISGIERELGALATN